MLTDTVQKREEILDEMRLIERLRQGTISEQYYGTGESRQGPYYVLQGYADGKHWSKRIKKDQVEQVRADLEAGIHFKNLCQKFAEVTEASAMTEDAPAEKKSVKTRSKTVITKPKHS